MPPSSSSMASSMIFNPRWSRARTVKHRASDSLSPRSRGRNGAQSGDGEQVKVPAKRVFKFLAAKALKEAVMSKRGSRGGTARKKAGAKPPRARRRLTKTSSRKKR